MSILRELSTYVPPIKEEAAMDEAYEALLESIEDLLERAEQSPEQTKLQDPTKKLSMSRVHTVMLSPSDKGLGLKDKVFGIRNEDPIVDFMLDIMGVPRDGSAIRIRSGFMQYDQRSKMLFIGRYKSDLPGERKQAVKESTDDAFIDKVLSALPEPIDNRSMKLIKSDISTRQSKGWTAAEIVSYLRNMEDFNPDLDEDRALRNMRAVEAQVAERLQGEKK